MSLIYSLKYLGRPAYAQVMIRKLRSRLLERTTPESFESNLLWLENVCEELEPLANQLDYELWCEAKMFAMDLRTKSASVLSQVHVPLGGPGHYALLYFITRYYKPRIVVETGVAAGFSTQAFLKAMQLNRRGYLYSSDFPYFRLKNPDRYIGIVVQQELKERWKLYVRGDRSNLQDILASIPKIDIFHYDSDKYYSSRRFAMSAISRFLVKDSIIVIDDVQDNLFFRDYVGGKSGRWKVFNFEDKYVGVIGMKDSWLLDVSR